MGMARGKDASLDLVELVALLTRYLQTKTTKKSKKAGKGSLTSKNIPASGSGTRADAMPAATGNGVTKRHQAPQVEEADDE